jgi:hypothetical protein
MDKTGLSALDSEVPTLAPSRVSLSDDGKVSAAGEHTDVDLSSNPVETSDEKHDEKHADLARQSTATSKTGKPLEQTPTREDGTEYPKGVTLSLIVLALCLSVFVMALGKPFPFPPVPPPKLTATDNSIIATAIPSITTQFNSLADVGWYASGTPHP